MPIPILTHHQKKVTPKSKVVFPNENKNTKVQNELEKQKEEASARMKTSIKESVEKNGFLLSGAGQQEGSPIPKKDLNMIDIERAVMLGQLIQEDKHLVEKNAWIDEKEILKSRISELESFNYSLTNEKNKLYSENVGLQAENFTLSTTADELSEALEKNRYLEETLQKRNEFIKTLQDEQYELGETIEALNLKTPKKDEFIKDLQDQKFEVEVDLEEAKETILTLNEKINNLEDHINKNFSELSALYEDKFKLEKDLKYKNSLLTSNLRFWELLEESYKIEIKDLKEKLQTSDCNFKSSQRLLHSTADELSECQNELSEAKLAIGAKNISLCIRKEYIENLENQIIKYASKKNLFETSKENGTFYFAIWSFVWSFIIALIWGV